MLHCKWTTRNEDYDSVSRKRGQLNLSELSYFITGEFSNRTLEAGKAFGRGGGLRVMRGRQVGLG